MSGSVICLVTLIVYGIELQHVQVLKYFFEVSSFCASAASIFLWHFTSRVEISTETLAVS